nr:DUF2314 domain-containing protein [Pseudogemmobacter hezensis]
MNKAIEDAKKSLPGFLQRAAAADLSGSDYMVKWAHPTEWGDTEVEHIWVGVERIEGDTVLGRFANQPQGFTGEMGDIAVVPVAQISDWMLYREDGSVEGSYTTRVMLAQMSEAERAEIGVTFAPLPEE